MFENLEAVLRDKCKLTKDAPIIVGVSGGADSLSLMDVLISNGYRVIVAHLNHQLRPDSDVDANAVERLAGRLNLLSAIEAVEVNEYALKYNLTIEAAAREVRYRFLFDQAKKYGAQAVAVGHTADDQVETILMHFLQGAGLRGLSGMPYRSINPAFDPDIPLVRPLLELWHEDIIVYCAMKGLKPHEDVTNSDVSFLRNRLRHLLIPQLESYNPRFREAVWRTSQTLAIDYEALSEMTDNAWQASLTESLEGSTLAFNLEMLMDYPQGIQRNILRRACRELCGDVRDMDYEAILRVLDFLSSSRQGEVLDLPGSAKIFVEGSDVYLTVDPIHLPGNWPRLSDDILPIPVPGQINLPGEWTLSIELWDMPALAREQIRKNHDPYKAWLDADKLTAALTLRPRRTGDRFEPFGMNGHTMKLSDYFINEKIPRRLRDRWPLLCQGEETVAWVPGYRPAHSFRLDDSTQRVLYLHLSKPDKKR